VSDVKRNIEATQAYIKEKYGPKQPPNLTVEIRGRKIVLTVTEGEEALASLMDWEANELGLMARDALRGLLKGEANA
jgi:hypothetical protein